MNTLSDIISQSWSLLREQHMGKSEIDNNRCGANGSADISSCEPASDRIGRTKLCDGGQSGS
ncbi:MAG: hypothetical protein U9Q07_14470 [Planctomycetota bacterium]|nr:hypothetical protein [Planctomycetota bacterium]